MTKRCDFKAETKRGLKFQRAMGRILILAHAEEDNGSSAPEGNKTPELNFEQMIAQARKEEKEKLYPRIHKAEEDVKTLTTANNKYLLEIAALKDAMEKSKNDPEKDSKVKELESKIQALEEENKTLKETTPKEEEIRKRIEAEYEVKLYAEKQIAENKDSILSMLIPDIKGATKEEIDTAIASAKDKTLSVKKDLGLIDEDGKETKKKKGESTPPPAKKKKAPASVPPIDEEEEFDAEYIRNLDPASPEYKEFRKKLGLK